MTRGGGGEILKLEARNFSSPLANGAIFLGAPPPLLLGLKYTHFRSPPFECLKIFGAPPQYLHPPPLVILYELSLSFQNFRTLKLGLYFCVDFLALSELIGHLDLTDSYEIWPKCSLVINAQNCVALRTQMVEQRINSEV